MNAFFAPTPLFCPPTSPPEGNSSKSLPTMNFLHTSATASPDMQDDSSFEALPPRRLSFSDSLPYVAGDSNGDRHTSLSQLMQSALTVPGLSTFALHENTPTLPYTTPRTLNPLQLRLDHISVAPRPRESIASSTTSQAGRSVEDRKRRVRSGCLTCRFRKVKCDELRPRCKRCSIAVRDCSWPSEGNQKNRSRSSKGGVNAKGRDKPTEIPPTTILPLTRTHAHMPAHTSQTSPTKSLVTVTTTTTTSMMPPRRRSDDVVMGAGLLGKDRMLEELVPKGMRAKLLSNPSFLHSYFPSVDEKLVIHHYINETVRNIVALDVPPTNPWIEWHAPMAFSVPRGSSLACDALQLAMLSIGAIHLRYLTPGGAPPSTTDFARSARARTLAMLRRSIDMSTTNDESEIILGALLSCMISSSLAGDDAWQEILTLAASLIDRSGGIEVFLAKASRSHQSSFRFLMEQLATRDVFGCLTTGVAPTFLNTGFSPWWFEVEGWSAADDEWESVERMFGISRAMVDLMARVCTVVAKKRLHSFHLRETPILPSGSAQIVQDVIRVGHSHDSIEDEEHATLEVIANDLLEEIEVWKSTSHFRRAHPRVQYGNHAHLHAMKIHLLKNGFDVQQEERIHEASRTILELCTETVAMFGRVVWMTWPVLMAGLHLPAHEIQHRQTIRNLLLEFAPHAFFDNKLAISLLQEYWSKVDDGVSADWWSLTRELGRAPFFD